MKLQQLFESEQLVQDFSDWEEYKSNMATTLPTNLAKCLKGNTKNSITTLYVKGGEVYSAAGPDTLFQGIIYPLLDPSIIMSVREYDRDHDDFYENADFTGLYKRLRALVFDMLKPLITGEEIEDAAVRKVAKQFDIIEECFDDMNVDGTTVLYGENLSRRQIYFALQNFIKFVKEHCVHIGNLDTHPAADTYGILAAVDAIKRAYTERNITNDSDMHPNLIPYFKKTFSAHIDDIVEEKKNAVFNDGAIVNAVNELKVLNIPSLTEYLNEVLDNAVKTIMDNPRKFKTSARRFDGAASTVLRILSKTNSLSRHRDFEEWLLNIRNE